MCETFPYPAVSLLRVIDHKERDTGYLCLHRLSFYLSVSSFPPPPLSLSLSSFQFILFQPSSKLMGILYEKDGVLKY